MDPGYAEFNGASLAWLPPKPFAAPWYWENDDHAWVRFVLGGLCNTAGSSRSAIRRPSTYRTSSSMRGATDRFGTHDRIAIVPASHFNFGERWEGERCFLWCEGVMRQEIIYGENLRSRADTRPNSERAPSRCMTSCVTTATTRLPHQFLYHFNIGYPVVDEGAELLCTPSGPSRARSSTTTRRRVTAIGRSPVPEGVLRRGLRNPDDGRYGWVGVGGGREPRL